MLANISIGTDIEEISRFEKYEINEKFLNKIFTQNELEYCLAKPNPKQHLAARFSAKEAVIKALTGFGELNVFPKDIEIYHNENNVPQVRILKDDFESFSFRLSLSHSNNNAVAFVIAAKGDGNVL